MMFNDTGIDVSQMGLEVLALCKPCNKGQRVTVSPQTLDVVGSGADVASQMARAILEGLRMDGCLHNGTELDTHIERVDITGANPHRHEPIPSDVALLNRLKNALGIRPCSPKS